MTTVWLANSASLLLPVSNLTNLLAAGRIGNGSPSQFVALMAAPALVAILVPVAVLFVIYRRQLLVRYETAESTAPEDRVLLVASAVVVLVVLPALVSGIPVWIPAVIGAVVLACFFAARRREVLRFGLLPWQLVLLAAGLFVVIATASGLGLSALLGTVAGRGDGFLTLLRVAGTGVVASNAVNNLPAYLALETTAGSPIRLAALLVGVNVGPLITPWASLATLLWRQRLGTMDVAVSWPRYALLGAIVVPVTIVAAIGVLAALG
jgi:Na+/H+ antiporter NhaD/arsenite permease-like protein